MYQLIRDGLGWEDAVLVFKPKDIEAFRLLYLRRFIQAKKRADDKSI